MNYGLGRRPHQRIPRTATAGPRADGCRPLPTEPPDVGCALRPLVALAALAGVPPCRPRRRPLLDAASRAYSLAVVAGLAAMGYATSAHVIELYGHTCHSYYVPELVGRCVVSCAACVSVLSLLFAGGNWLSVFTDEIRRVDDLLSVDKWKAHRTAQIYLFASLGLFLASYTANIVFDAFVISPYDALVEIVILVIIVTFEQFLIFALIIRHRFVLLNEAVLSMFSPQLECFGRLSASAIRSGRCRLPDPHLPGVDSSLKQSPWPVSADQLLTIKIAHMKLSRLSDALNDVYGVPITVLVFQALVSVVQVVFNVLLRFLDQDESNDAMIVPDLCYVLLTLSVMVVLAACCQSTVSEARRTASIAEDLILANAAGGGSEPLGEQLRQLSRQVRHNPVSFSACSLFSVDAPLLTGFVATVATYIIILLQFVVSNKGCYLATGPDSSAAGGFNETTSSSPDGSY